MSGRIRTVKPEWLEDELVAGASDAGRVLSIALILMADDYGCGRASIANLAAEAWRFELERDDGANARETLAKVSRALREMLDAKFVVLYEVGRQRYFWIRNWSKHQRVDKPGKPRVPGPPPDVITDDCLANSDIRETLARPSRDIPDAGATSSRLTCTSDLIPPTTTTTTPIAPLALVCADAPPANPRTRKPRATGVTSDERAAWVVWCEVVGRRDPARPPSTPNAAAIRKALAAHDVATVCDAFRGVALSAHHMAEAAYREPASMLRLSDARIEGHAGRWRERGTEATVSAVAVQEAQAEQAARSKASREKTEALIARDEAQIRFSVAQRAIGLRWEARTQSWIPIEPKQEAGDF